MGASPSCGASHPPRTPQAVRERGLAAAGGEGALAEVTTAAEFLSLRRTFQGLMPGAPQEGDAPTQAAAGQSGRAASYAGEGAQTSV